MDRRTAAISSSNIVGQWNRLEVCRMILVVIKKVIWRIYDWYHGQKFLTQRVSMLDEFAWLWEKAPWDVEIRSPAKTRMSDVEELLGLTLDTQSFTHTRASKRSFFTRSLSDFLFVFHFTELWKNVTIFLRKFPFDGGRVLHINELPTCGLYQLITEWSRVRFLASTSDVCSSSSWSFLLFASHMHLVFPFTLKDGRATVMKLIKSRLKIVSLSFIDF